MGKFFYKNNNYRQGGKVKYDNGGKPMFESGLSAYAGPNAGAGINFTPRLNMGYASNLGDDASDLVKAGNMQLGANLGLGMRANTAGITTSYTQPFGTEGPLKNLAFRGSTDIGMTQRNERNTDGVYGNFAAGLGYNKAGMGELVGGGENYKYGKGINATLGANVGSTGHRAGKGVYGEVEGTYGPFSIFGGRGGQGNYGGVGLNFPFEEGGKLDPKFIEAYKRFNQGKRPQQFNQGGQVGDHGVPFMEEEESGNMLSTVKDYFTNDEFKQYKDQLGEQITGLPSEVGQSLSTGVQEIGQNVKSFFTPSGGGTYSGDQSGSYDPNIDYSALEVEVPNTTGFQKLMGKAGQLKQAVGKGTAVLGAADTGLGFIKDIADGGDASGQQNVGAGAIDSAMKGAQAGAAFGGVGALIGGGVGALTGGISALQNRQALQNEEKQVFNKKVAESTNNALLQYLKDKDQPVQQTMPDAPVVEQAENGMRINDNDMMPTDSIYNRQIFTESRYKSDAVSPAGATSIAQIMPNTFKDGLKKGYVPKGTKYEDLAKNDNLALQFRDSYMSDLLTRDWNKGTDKVKMAKALAAYNLGPTGMLRILKKSKNTKDIYNSLDWVEDLPKETREYVNKILIGGDEDFESEYKRLYKTYKSGGMTQGEYNHTTNPLAVVDSNGNHTGMELTGGEGVYDSKAQNKIELALKKKDYKKVGKIIEYEINDWKKRGMYS